LDLPEEPVVPGLGLLQVGLGLPRGRRLKGHRTKAVRAPEQGHPNQAPPEQGHPNQAWLEPQLVMDRQKEEGELLHRPAAAELREILRNLPGWVVGHQEAFPFGFGPADPVRVDASYPDCLRDREKAAHWWEDQCHRETVECLWFAYSERETEVPLRFDQNRQPSVVALPCQNLPAAVDPNWFRGRNFLAMVRMVPELDSLARRPFHQDFVKVVRPFLAFLVRPFLVRPFLVRPFPVHPFPVRPFPVHPFLVRPFLLDPVVASAAFQKGVHPSCSAEHHTYYHQMAACPDRTAAEAFRLHRKDSPLRILQTAVPLPGVHS